MFTIVASSTTISWATPSKASTAQRLGSRRSGMVTGEGVTGPKLAIGLVGGRLRGQPP